MPPVSIIILTRNRLPKLKTCLDRVLPQLEGEEEICLVDTGSTDGTVEEFESNPPERVKFFKFGGPGSWAEARNFGVKKSTNPLIAFLDDDCYAAADWVQRGRADLGSLDAVGGLVSPYQITSWPDWWDPEMGWLVGISVPGHLGPEAGRYFYPYTSNLWARASVLRAEPFQELGGEFHAEEGKRYQTGREDAEWWRRIRVRGYRTRFDAELKVEHHIEKDRINFDYLLERARRDGEAWAAREGTGEDLEAIAYQYWIHTVPSRDEKNPSNTEFASSPNPTGRRRFHQFMAHRYRAALHALATKLASNDSSKFSARAVANRAIRRAGRKFLRDRARTIARKVVMAFSPTRKSAIDKPTSIAIAAFGFVGDLVILQSCLRGVIHNNPALEKISLLTHYPATLIINNIPQVDLTIVPWSESRLVESFWADPELPSFGEAWRFLADYLDRIKPQAILAPYLHGDWGPLLVRLLHKFRRHVPPIISFDCDTGLERQLDRERMNLTAGKNLGLHECVNLSKLFEVVGLTSEPRPSHIEPWPRSIEWAHHWRVKFDPTMCQPLLMINPDAGKRFKEWTDEGWKSVIEKLLEGTAYTFVINESYSRPELRRLIQERIGVHPRIQWLRDESLEHLIAVLALCEAIITVDAGPQHLAHALNVPSLTLYGPMDERRWGDYWKRPIHQTIRGGSFDLTPEELRGLPENHIMTLLKPEAVIEKAMEWIKTFPAKETSPQ